MKRIFLSITGVLLATLTLSAQIILDQSSYPTSVLGTDTIANTTVTSSFPPLESSTNATWDMTVVTDSIVPSFVDRVASSLSFEYANVKSYNFGGYSYQGNVQSNVTTSGLLEYCISIPLSVYNISLVTHGLTDSIIIPSQTDTFSTPHVVIGFPASFNSTWSSEFFDTFNYRISIAILSYNHAPGLVRHYVSETDTVKGWGEMRVKDLAGVPSSYFGVLQVQKTVYTVDSFYLNGVLAPTILLNTLGFAQGQRDTSYFQDYYRAEEVTPFAEVTYGDATFSKPKKAATHVQRLVNEGIPEMAQSAQFAIYPNPVIGGKVTISLPGGYGNWSYELSDLNGRIFDFGYIKSSNGEAEVLLPSSIEPGTYYLKVFDNKVEYSVKAIEVKR